MTGISDGPIPLSLADNSLDILWTPMADQGARFDFLTHAAHTLRTKLSDS